MLSQPESGEISGYWGMDSDLVKGQDRHDLGVEGTFTVNGFGIQLVLLVTDRKHENSGKKIRAPAPETATRCFHVAQEV